MNKKLINTLNLYFFSTILFSQVFSYSLCAKPISYKPDTNNSKVGFSVKHKITRDVYGEFLKSIGTADYNSKTDKIFNIESVIDVQSIDTGNTRRDRHLKSPDFFDAKNHPKIYFKSNNVELISENQYNIITFEVNFWMVVSIKKIRTFKVPISPSISCIYRLDINY